MTGFVLNRAKWLLFAVAMVASADPIDVGSSTFVTVAHGATLDLQFSVWNYGANNPGVSAYPTAIGFQILGPVAAGAAQQYIPGTSLAYFSDFNFQADLESADGSVSVPIVNSYATRLGMAPGTLLFVPGMWTASTSTAVPVMMGSGSQNLTPSVSQSIFGPNVTNPNDVAVIRLQNLGAALTFGLAPGYTVRNAASEPDIGGAGPATTAGITHSVMYNGPTPTATPEPSSLLLFSAGIAAILLASWRKKISS